MLGLVVLPLVVDR